ncbi:MAG: patatin family protein, partial [Deltaproteobacteria bacterium]|nr:patatin family protein [Deltaproteobacteria bacterium]
RNARLDPNWSSVERRTLDITGRAISSLIHTQGIGDLYQMYLISKRDGIDFNLAFI